MLDVITGCFLVCIFQNIMPILVAVVAVTMLNRITLIVFAMLLILLVVSARVTAGHFSRTGHTVPPIIGVIINLALFQINPTRQVARPRAALWDASFGDS